MWNQLNCVTCTKDHAVSVHLNPRQHCAALNVVRVQGSAASSPHLGFRPGCTHEWQVCHLVFSVGLPALVSNAAGRKTEAPQAC